MAMQCSNELLIPIQDHVHKHQLCPLIDFRQAEFETRYRRQEED
jgi:hypothetical protein